MHQILHFRLFSVPSCKPETFPRNDKSKNYRRTGTYRSFTRCCRQPAFRFAKSRLHKIVDPEDGVTEYGNNQPGELLAKGPQVMLGYWNHPEETANSIRDGWLYTGDIAYRDDDGYYFIVDRKKDMAIVGGYNVYPSEIDEVLYEYPKIHEAVSLSIPHRSKGEILKAYIVPKPGEKINTAEIMAFCREKLASYKVPRMIEIREELPKSMVGKILRRALRDEEEKKLQAEKDKENNAKEENNH